eukprot:gene28691-34638_t
MIGSALHSFFVDLDDSRERQLAEYDSYGDDVSGTKRKAVNLDSSLMKIKLSQGLAELRSYQHSNNDEKFLEDIIKLSKSLQWSRFSDKELSSVVNFLCGSLSEFEDIAYAPISILITIIFALQASSPALPNLYKLRLHIMEQCIQGYSRLSPVSDTKADARATVNQLKFINKVLITEIKNTSKVSFDLQAYRIMVIYTLLPWHLRYLIKRSFSQGDFVNQCLASISTSVLEISIASHRTYIALTTDELSKSSTSSCFKKDRLPYKDEIRKKIVRSFAWKIDEEAAYYVQLMEVKRNQQSLRKNSEQGTQCDGTRNVDVITDDADNGEESDCEDQGGKRLRGLDRKVRFWNDSVFKQYGQSSSVVGASVPSGSSSSLVDIYNSVITQFDNDLPSLFMVHLCSILDSCQVGIDAKQFLLLQTYYVVRKTCVKHLSRALPNDAADIGGHSILVQSLVDVLQSNILVVVQKVTSGEHWSQREELQVLFDLEVSTLILAFGNKLLLNKKTLLEYINQYCIVYMEAGESLVFMRTLHRQFSQSLFTMLFHRVYDFCDPHIEAADCKANVRLLLEDYLDILLPGLCATNILGLYIYVLPILQVPLDVTLLDQVHSTMKHEFEGLGVGLGGSVRRMDEEMYDSVCPSVHPSLQMVLTAWPVPPSSYSSAAQAAQLNAITIPHPSSLSPRNLLSLYKQALLPLLSPLHHKGGVQIDRSIYNLTLLSLPPEALLNIVQYLPFKKVCRLSSVCVSLHNLLFVQHEERVWRQAYQTFFTRSVFADRIDGKERKASEKQVINNLCTVCLDRRIAELEGYDSLGEKQGRNPGDPVISKNGKFKWKRNVNESCCMSMCTNHAWRLLLKERVQELRGLRKQQQQIKSMRSNAGFRACPVIGCPVVINSVSKETMEEHLKEHIAALTDLFLDPYEDVKPDDRRRIQIQNLAMSSNDDQDETLPLDEIHAGGFGSPVSSQRPPLPNNLVHSSPMVILSSQRDRGSAQWSQSAQGTPIRTSQHVAPRGDLGGRTPATLRGLRDVIPNTPMDGGVIGATQTLPTGMTRRNLSEQPDESDEDNDDFLKSTQPFVPTSLTQAQIWGTEINVQHCVNAFSSFLEHFSLDAQSGLSHYAQVFVDMCNEGSSVLNLDCGHLLRYAATRSLYDQLVRYPQEIIPLLDEVATSLYHSLNLIHNPHYTAPDQP